MFSAFLLAATLSLVQVPEAPFVEKDTVLESPHLVLKSDCIKAGTKSLSWPNRGDNLEIQANGHAIVQFQTRVAPSFPSWQPFKHFEFSYAYAQTNSRQVTAVSRQYAFGMTKEAKGLFTQSFSLSGNEALVKTHFTPAPGVPLKSQIFTFSIPRDEAKGRTIRLTNAKGVSRTEKIPDDDAWDDRKDPAAHLWSGNGWIDDPVEIVFDAQHPAHAVTLRFPSGTFSHVNVFRSLTDIHFYPSFDQKNALGRPFEMRVDFGRCAVPKQGDCIVDGINFTQNNAFEVLRWGKRNLLNNPSFESDSRYWHNAHGAALLDKYIVKDPHSGKYAYMMDCSPHAFSVPTKPNTTYTFSCWAKSVNGDGGGFSFSTMNYQGSSGNVNNKHLYLKNRTKQWQRLSYTFKWPHKGMMVFLSGHSSTPGRLVIDDVQLEEGEKATDFEAPPFGVVLKTDSPDRYYGDASCVFNARIVIRGKAGVKAKARIAITDFFGRNTWNDQREVTLGESGEAELPCPESAVSAKGVYVIRVELDDGSARPFVDHVRLMRYKFASGREPNRELHQNSGMGWHTRNETKYDVRNWHRFQSMGIQNFTQNVCDWWGAYDETIRTNVANWYLTHGGRIKQELFPQNFKKAKCKHPLYRYLLDEGIPQENMPDVTTGYGEKELQAVERAVYRLVKEQPWCEDWIGTSEMGQQWLIARTHDYKAYVRIMMAAHRALKKANPKARFYVHGTCNAGQQGRAELHEVMEATKAVDPAWAWDGLQVHPYRPHPEFPSLEGDLGLLFADMARHNMPQGLVAADEGAYFFPIIVKEWNDIAPWSGTYETDQYCHMHTPSYDLGWGERVATAMLMRYNLQCYRYVPRIRYVTCWVNAMLDSNLSWALYAGTAAETELLGYAKWRKGIRFGNGARALFFDDGKDSALAAVWKFNVALDRGLEKAAEMYLDPAFLQSCEVYDMMANRCRAEKGTLPLSNYPLYLRVPLAKYDVLVAAVEKAKTSDDGREKKIYNPRPVTIPQCEGKPNWKRITPFSLPYVELSRTSRRNGTKWTGPEDLSAECRMAWSKQGLYLQVVVQDDVFLLDRSTYRFGETQWYACEGVQVFFDNLGDAREHFKMEMSGFDDNDSVYELLPVSETSAIVYRRVAPDIQQTGGVGDPLRAEVVVPEVKCAFKWDAVAKKRTYEAFFPARQLMPMPLEKGTRIGCSVNVFDRDAPGKDTKQWTTDVPPCEGSAYQCPHLLSNFVLGGCKMDKAVSMVSIPQLEKRLIAHRGESYDTPENTLPAYRMAVARGFGFECDVYLSQDGRVFTFHDGNLKRTSGGKLDKPCSKANWAREVSKLDVGNWGKWRASQYAGTRPALLEEVCDLAQQDRWIYCEVKGSDPTLIVPAIAKVLQAQTKATPKNFLFISFSQAICAALKEQLPQYRVYWLTSTVDEKRQPLKVEDLIGVLRKTKADGVDACYVPRVVTKEYIEAVRQAGFDFHVWTIDAPEMAAEAFQRGAQTVTTNRAKYLFETLQN